ncbi:hypothetical protein MMC24_005291 [Lignoscripta atroalba]|nr:hypothetical protein [Lignoscripta atroalba]
MEGIHIPELVERLGSDEDAVRKMAVFKLQSAIGDPSFADIFIADGGLTKLRYLTLHATGNTLAYSLTSFSRLLEVDKGWEYVNQDLVERVGVPHLCKPLLVIDSSNLQVVELVVTHPLVNILRGAMSILVAIVSHPHTSISKTSQPDAFGFRALKPAIAVYPQFLEMLVSRLSSADHALCTNALQLINSLMRDAISNDSDLEWPRFIRRLQDLGVIKAVYGLMQSTALQDLAHPLLEFQALTKVLLRKWRDVAVDLEKSEHRRALKGIHLASNPEKVAEKMESGDDGKKRHNPEKWRRLGFGSESPVWEFEDVGFLGMMDLADYVTKHEDAFQKLLLEQSAQPTERRCPIAKASLAVTAILYEHFEVDKSDLEDAKGYLALETRSNIDKVFKPLILQWSRLHTSGLQAFMRLWKSTGAQVEDFMKIVELVRILLEAVVGGATRTKDVQEVEDEIADFDYQRLRELQMELIELTYEDTWGRHLRQVRDELNHEALQFVKEQRVRCLLQGAWFPNGASYKAETGPVTKEDLKRSTPSSYRYVRLSHNRRYLHYADFEAQGDYEPSLDALPEKSKPTTIQKQLIIKHKVQANPSPPPQVDLSIVSSVSSNVSATSPDSNSNSSTSTLKNLPHHHSSSTKITIHGYLLATTTSSSSTTSPSAPVPVSTSTSNPTHNHHHTRTNSSKHSASTTSTNNHPNKKKESVLLTLHPASQTLASEWLDGLLMLLNQQPITAETNKLVRLVSDYGLKIRLLNVRFDDLPQVGSGGGGGGGGRGRGGDSGGGGGGGAGRGSYGVEIPEMPSREGLDEDYYYDVFGT